MARLLEPRGAIAQRLDVGGELRDGTSERIGLGNHVRRPSAPIVSSRHRIDTGDG
jgi:hypothetical protein